MEFQGSKPSVVRSIKQRDLLNIWLRAWAKNQRAPEIADFQPDRIADEMADLVFLSVVEENGAQRFRIDDDGHRLADAFGAPGKGSYLDDYFGPKLAPTIMPVYRECAQRGLPAYTISMVKDVYDRDVAYERLILPFSEGHSITRMMASLKTISDDGCFEIRNLMRGHDVIPEFNVRVIIDRDLVQTRNSNIPDVVEFS